METGKKHLHNEALRILMSIQYYMSTLNHMGNEHIRNHNYRRCLLTMEEVVKTLIRTTVEETDPIAQGNYPEELLLIENKIANINQRISLMEQPHSTTGSPMDLRLMEK